MNNALQNEKSNYLQHQKNSLVSWNPFSMEVLEYAEKNQKPLFLSIGSLNSSWSKLMDVETFNNPQIAIFLNENFVCIKMDRDEYPDLSLFFIKAALYYGNNINDYDMCINAFLLNDFAPYFVTTYHPAANSNQNKGFLEIITELKRAFNENIESVQNNAKQVLIAMKNHNRLKDQISFEGHFPHAESIIRVVGQFEDKKNLGYGNFPKKINFTFYEWAIEQMLEGMITKESGEFIVKSIEKALFSPLIDHCRGGIHPCCYDDQWSVPNFQKKLPDQSSLIKLLAKFSLISPSPLVYDVIIDTIKYLRDEMLFQSETEKNKSYFFNSQDGFSEGIEGLYHTFTLEEFEESLAKHDDENENLVSNSSKLVSWFNVKVGGNIQNGLNTIQLNIEEKNTIMNPENWELIRKTKRAILKERRKRLPPMTDNQGVAVDNFQVISALIDVIQYVRIEPIKKMAIDLINDSIEGIFQTFVIRNEQGLIIKNTTTVKSPQSLSEDLISLAECQLRLYEITANENFKKNFFELIVLVLKDFVSEKDIFFRSESIFRRNELNMSLDNMDIFRKSAVSTFVGLCLKADCLFPNNNFRGKIEHITSSLKQTALFNPIMSGEALRVLIYPEIVYRKISVPVSWANEPRFTQSMLYFLNRFVIDYTPSQSWEISNNQGTEISGKSIEEFINSLTSGAGDRT